MAWSVSLKTIGASQFAIACFFRTTHINKIFALSASLGGATSALSATYFAHQLIRTSEHLHLGITVRLSTPNDCLRVHAILIYSIIPLALKKWALYHARLWVR